MKRSLSIIFLLTCVTSFGQLTEFERSDNGLIYPDSTIKQLKFIVDSLNIKFRVCELQKQYYSKAQAIAHFVSLDTGNIKGARHDLINGISFEDFINKYPGATWDTNLLVVRFQYKNYDEKQVVDFSSVELDGKHDHTISFTENLNRFKNLQKGSWISEYSKATDYSEEEINAFYLVTPFHSIPLIEKYARLVQYSDCMVDTSAEIFTNAAKRGSFNFSSKKKSQVITFLDYVYLKTNMPRYEWKSEDSHEVYIQKLHASDSLRFIIADSLERSDPKFRQLFMQALAEALNKGTGYDEFEEYAERYDSKKTALQLKRARKVVGMCSMDDSPRVHAMNIAQLSAETINWEIFLRSHLDIMNDRFERASDGSYAWARRKTYIKELELLNINLMDLMLGISLRIENPAQHHYYGSIGRLGRALAESEHRQAIETRMLDMIRDRQLDDYNRVLMYYLYLNCTDYLEDKVLQQQNLEKLKEAVSSLPSYISGKIDFKKG
jgi:hypothetical protein